MNKEHLAKIDSILSKYQKELNEEKISNSPFPDIYESNTLNAFKSELTLGIKNKHITPISIALKIAETKEDYWRDALKDFFAEGRSSYFNSTIEDLSKDMPSLILSDAKVDNYAFEKSYKGVEQRKNTFDYLSYLKAKSIHQPTEQSHYITKVLDTLQNVIEKQMPLQERIAVLSHSPEGFLKSYDFDELYEDAVSTKNTDLRNKLDIIRTSYLQSNDVIKDGGLIADGKIQICFADLSDKGNLNANYFEIHDDEHLRFNTFDFKNGTMGVYSKEKSFAKEYSFSDISFQLEPYYKNPSLINDAPKPIQIAFIKEDYKNILHFKDEILDTDKDLRKIAIETRKLEMVRGNTEKRIENLKPKKKEIDIERER